MAREVSPAAEAAMMASTSAAVSLWRLENDTVTCARSPCTSSTMGSSAPASFGTSSQCRGVRSAAVTSRTSAPDGSVVASHR